MSSWVLRTLGVVALVAFLSLWVQIHTLVGSQGILPFAQAIPDDLWSKPSLLWFWPTDRALHLACATGVVGSLALASGRVREGPVLLVVWATYLSLSMVGQRFLGFQWDTLLLETLFVSAFVARWRAEGWAPTHAGRWVLRLTLFKLMVGSGLVKLMANDLTWWNGTALAYHYWTQPLPNPLSWYAHHLPAAWHTFETWATLAIELVLPFAMFAGRWGRRLAFVGFTVVLLALFVTGNYGFFQLLSMVLVLSLLDEDELPSGLDRPDAPRAFQWVTGALVVLILGAGAIMEYGRVYSYRDLHPTALTVARWVHPWRTVNAYGLFGNMTESRPELVLEGSRDGKTWEPYVFHYKPGPLDRTPAIAGPHMPRVDWQLWFAALGRCEKNVWVTTLLQKFQANDPAVMGLLAHNPFPNQGPEHVRIRRVKYVFSTGGPTTWATEGPSRPYCR